MIGYTYQRRSSLPQFQDIQVPAVAITRQGVAVAGATTRINANVLKWTPAETTTWLPGAQYTLSAVDVEDLAANAAVVASMAFTHLVTESDQLLIARQAATESVPSGAGAYGLTTLFQGRTWHSDLGMYYYRARWYLPEGGVFGERDPVGAGSESSLYSFLAYDLWNLVDPMGRLPGAPNKTNPFGGLWWISDYRRELMHAAGDQWGKNAPDLGEIAGILDDTTNLVSSWLSLASPTDFASAYLTAGLMDLAENYGGSAGASIEGAAVFGVFGGHGGINWQWFAPKMDDPRRQYTLAFFRFDTIRQLRGSAEGRGEGKPPMGVLGALYSAGLGVNVAMAFQENSPRWWTGFFETISVSWIVEPPIPSGLSVFYSRGRDGRPLYAGAEVSWGVGEGFSYTRPYFKQFLFELHLDRSTLEAFVSNGLFRKIVGLKLPSAKFISMW